MMEPKLCGFPFHHVCARGIGTVERDCDDVRRPGQFVKLEKKKKKKMKKNAETECAGEASR